MDTKASIHITLITTNVYSNYSVILVFDMFYMKSFKPRRKDVFTWETISKGHFYQGHSPQGTFLQGRNLEDIFCEDQNPGTFRQGHW